MGLCWLKYDCLVKGAAQILCNNVEFITIFKYGPQRDKTGLRGV